ncbi:helix-turn-helix domain-containing protein [Salinimicrobium marinum]
MKLYIKNMVCNRCIMVVQSELKKFGLHPVSVELGEVEISDDMNEEEKEALNEVLSQLGFQLISDKKSRWIEQIKNAVVELVHHQEEQIKTNLSTYISEKLHADYSYLSNLFSEVQGVTIEQYYIAQKIERVKELLVYDELSLSEIADELNYSSVSHLSKQFKKVTGLTPTHFRQVKEKKRKPLDEV